MERYWLCGITAESYKWCMKWEIPAQSTELNLCYLLWKSAQLQAEKPTKSRSYRLRKPKPTLSILFSLCTWDNPGHGTVGCRRSRGGQVLTAQMCWDVLHRLWVEDSPKLSEKLLYLHLNGGDEGNRGSACAAEETVGLIQSHTCPSCSRQAVLQLAAVQQDCTFTVVAVSTL